MIPLIRWLWEGEGVTSWIVRFALLPPAALYGVVMWIRETAYRQGWLTTSTLPLRSIAVGNLTVGGTGKTPLAAWLANWFLRHGAKPAILLRGYGDDEPLVHAQLVPGAVVQANPDRRAGALAAVHAGADLLVLDDAFQTLRIRRDLNLVLVAVEQLAYSPFLLPAGPWREAWGALGRANGVIVTRKRASAASAATVADRIATKTRPRTPVGIVHLAISGFEGLRSGQPVGGETLAGRRLLAAAGIADPDSFAAQLQERTGKSGAVQLVTYQDHHAYSDGDVAALLSAAATADYVVVTEKDAVKLRSRWPAAAREPLVATLGVQWERGQEAFEALLSTLIHSSTPAI